MGERALGDTGRPVVCSLAPRARPRHARRRTTGENGNIAAAIHLDDATIRFAMASMGAEDQQATSEPTPVDAAAASPDSSSGTAQGGAPAPTFGSRPAPGTVAARLDSLGREDGAQGSAVDIPASSRGDHGSSASSFGDLSVSSYGDSEADEHGAWTRHVRL